MHLGGVEKCEVAGGASGHPSIVPGPDPDRRAFAAPPSRPDSLAWAEASDRAMPGEERASFGPWLARRARQVTGRANSAFLAEPDQGKAAANLAELADWYRAVGASPIVQGWRSAETPGGALDHPAGAADTVLLEEAWERGPGAVVYARPAAGFTARRRSPTDIGIETGSDVADDVVASIGADRLAEMRTPLPTTIATARRTDGDRALLGRALAIIDPVADLVGIFAVEVAPEARGRGIADALMAALIAEASPSADATVWLQVAPDNLVARRLYERQGFEVVAAYDYWRPGAPDETVQPS
ncbi:MAG: GNAT family N-acetyltransferase [Acidimicrobiales bacterium]